jgi:beta-lactamase superfamily II metal-dependent hydrolase
LKIAKDAQKNYRWTKKLVTTAYDIPIDEKKKGKRRQIMSNLFVGDWTRLIEPVGQESKIRFRGGEGYVPSDSLGKERILEIYFIDVGQGDSILIQTADDKRILIDGGRDKSAYNFIKWKYNLRRYHKDFDAVIMTHGDLDHTGGLFPLLNDDHVLVRAIYHNGIAKRRKRPVLGKEKKVNRKKMLVELYGDIDDLKSKVGELTKTYRAWVEAVLKAKDRALRNNIDFKCIRADQNTKPLVIGKKKPLKINFLNPINLGSKNSPKLMKFGRPSETINGNSVAVLLEYGKARVLLCGDMNEKAERQFLDHCKQETPIAHVFKANHHGSQNFTTEFLRVIQPWLTVVSSGDQPDYGHPSASLLGSLGHYSPNVVEKPLLFSTEIAATFKCADSNSEKTGFQLYEKVNHGLVNVRTNGKWLAAGRVFNKRKGKGKGRYAKSLWDWERYAFNLKNGNPLTDNLLETVS